MGSKGQIVIPKIVRDSLGMKPGEDVVMEVRDREALIRPGMSPKDFVEDFCSLSAEKLKKKIDLERLLEQEAEERLALR